MNTLAAGLSGAPSFRQTALPWTTGAADERRFQRLLVGALLAALAVSLALQWAPSPADAPRPPLPAPSIDAPLPAVIARLTLPLPTPVVRKPAPTPTVPPPTSSPKETGVQPPSAKAPAQGPQPTAATQRQGADPQAAIDQARRKAAASGLLALQGELGALRGAPLQGVGASPATAAAKPQHLSPGVGAGADSGDAARALVTAAAGRGSGGLVVATAPTSRDGAGGGAGGGVSALASRSTTAVGVGGSGGGGGAAAGTGGAVSAGNGAVNGAVGGAGGSAGGSATKARGAVRATRPIDDVRLVFERQKGAIYALYHRALRDDPALKGKVVFELKIAASGAVESARVLSSELKSDDLERKLLARIRQFDFGAREVDALVLSWPVDFLPS